MTAQLSSVSAATSESERPTEEAETNADLAVVDVGIPTIGTSPGLVEAVESVLAQTLGSWRLTISENGPGLESVRSALEPYVRDPRILHVVTGEQTGRGANWTRLIHAGNAPFVGLLHDDDRWGPRFLEQRVRFLEDHANCGFVFSDYTVIDGSGRPMAKSKLEIPQGVHESSAIFSKLYRRMFVAAPTVLVRRTAYEAVGAEYKEIVFSDHEMWLRLAAHFDVGYIATWDADYRFHTEQTSSSRADGAKAKHSLHVLDAVEDLPIPRRTRKVGRAEALVWCALDDIEQGDRRRAIERLGEAVRTDASCVVRPAIAARMLAAVAALATGTPGRRALTHVRTRRWQNRRKRGISFAAHMTQIKSPD